MVMTLAPMESAKISKREEALTLKALQLNGLTDMNPVIELDPKKYR